MIGVNYGGLGIDQIRALQAKTNRPARISGVAPAAHSQASVSQPVVGRGQGVEEGREGAVRRGGGAGDCECGPGAGAGEAAVNKQGGDMCMKVACEPFCLISVNEFIKTMPRFNRKTGERITDSFTYKVCEVLERVMAEVSSIHFYPHTVVDIRLSVEHSEGNYAVDGTREGYWVKAELRVGEAEGETGEVPR